MTLNEISIGAAKGFVNLKGCRRSAILNFKACHPESRPDNYRDGMRDLSWWHLRFNLCVSFRSLLRREDVGAAPLQTAKVVIPNSDPITIGTGWGISLDNIWEEAYRLVTDLFLSICGGSLGTTRNKISIGAATNVQIYKYDGAAPLKPLSLSSLIPTR